ncbi:hypothetical protein G7Z17_g4886 [Cylindrodendrum hubeiense]|uniref:Uncharacterized protein n=1 Tax=Cylindrodendrum hubeiense TaxID=595255 RepID=A0A9P5LIG3_9HYPO|nr:hypothetical protein G7Z17_g4886 [Cylindrodendrum hubeiense]
MPSTPGAGTAEFKSPKTPRRYKTPEPRQVHFDPDDAVPASYMGRNSTDGGKTSGFTTANSPSGGFCSKIGGILKSGDSDKVDPTPTSFPQVGPAPTSHLQWHTAANPAQSISHQLPHTYNYATPQQQQLQHQHFLVAPQQFPHAAFTQQPEPVTYIGLHQQPQATMGDYQNCAPPPTGVHFQPPVPDTTFGPIPHVYVPRFDGGLVPSQPTVSAMHPQAAHGSYVVAQQPYLVQQPVMGQQPVMMHNQPAFMPQVQHMAGMPPVGLAGGAAINTGFPVIAGNTGHIPDVSGLGRTAGEETLRQIKFAYSNRLYEPQDFKPSDDDPSRFYFVREVDGNWTQRNRFSIDHMGDCRWYVTDEGWFYAVRLPS